MGSLRNETFTALKRLGLATVQEVHRDLFARGLICKRNRTIHSNEKNSAKKLSQVQVFDIFYISLIFFSLFFCY
jgi:hypothetical protein